MLAFCIDTRSLKGSSPMKYRFIYTLLGVALLALNNQSYADSKPSSAITYPRPGGVLCDKKSGFCADEQGVSVAITQMELGKKASKNLMDQIRAVGIQDFDATSFTMTGGLHCETKQKKCFTNKYDNVVDAKATKALFGKWGLIWLRIFYTPRYCRYELIPLPRENLPHR